DVGAQEFAVLAQEDLHETVLLVAGDGLAVGHEGQLAGLVLDAFFLERALGVTHAGHLGLAVGATGDVHLVQRMGVLTRQVFGGDDALVGSGVGQERGPGDVADGVDVGHAGLVGLVDADEALVGLHA